MTWSWQSLGKVGAGIGISSSSIYIIHGSAEKSRYVNQFIAPTQRFVHNNVVIRVSRILSVPEGTGALEPLDAPTPVLEDCRPVDPSGSYLFEAYVRVEDGTNSKLMEQAMQELMAVKNQLEGAVDLRVPDRLSLDTRVKGT